jgi:iron complex transport system substrate-binding protein
MTKAVILYERIEMLAACCPRPLRALLAAATLGLSLTGAALAQDDAAGASATDAHGRQCGGYPAPAFPDLIPIAAAPGTITAVSPFGEVQLPAAPHAALGMYTTDIDILIWLGYPLAGHQPIRGDSGYETFPCFFPQAPLTGLATFHNYPEYNYEQILLAEPDFILNGLGYDKAVNERLPQIAPTFSVDAFDGRSWQEHFRETAEALGRLDRYELWHDIYLRRVAEVRQLIAANAGALVAPLGYWDGKFNASCYAGVECTVFRDLGLTIFEGALSNGGEGVEISLEQIGQLADLDYVFTVVGVGEQGLAEQRAMMAEAGKNPLWSQLKIVRQQHIIPFEMEMVYGSPSGQLAFLEVVAEALSQ